MRPIIFKEATMEDIKLLRAFNEHSGYKVTIKEWNPTEHKRMFVPVGGWELNKEYKVEKV